MKVGLVGWRGMVGSVLMQRMVEENDFAHIEPFYFSTSNAGGEAPSFGGKTAPASYGSYRHYQSEANGCHYYLSRW